jgi:hypothetical protein
MAELESIEIEHYVIRRSCSVLPIWSAGTWS